MIGALINLVTGGVAAYKQHNQNRAQALKRKNVLESEKHQVRGRRLQNGEEQANSLDEVSIREWGTQRRVHSLGGVRAAHLIVYPNYAPYVEQGFDALQRIPNPYWFVVGAVVIDTLGMRAMVRYLLEFYVSRWKGK